MVLFYCRPSKMKLLKGIIRKIGNILNSKKGIGMKLGTALFLGGLILYMSGIYLSAIWEVAGAFIGIIGGIVMGSATFFLAKTKR